MSPGVRKDLLSALRQARGVRSALFRALGPDGDAIIQRIQADANTLEARILDRLRAEGVRQS